MEPEFGSFDAEGPRHFCEYLVTSLLSAEGVNSAIIFESSPARFATRGRAGLLAAIPHLDGLGTSLLAQLQVSDTGSGLTLHSSVKDLMRAQPELGLPAQVQALLLVGDHSLAATRSWLLLTFDHELSIAQVEAVRKALPILRAGLKVFVTDAPVGFQPDLSRLSKRQVQILQYIIDGHQYATISQLLFVSLSTVKQEARRIFEILGAKNKSEIESMLGPR